MKIYLKLDVRTSKKTELGFPLIAYIYKDKKNRKEKTIGYYAHLKHWDAKDVNVRSSHPDYLFLFDYLEDLKTTMRKVANMAKRKTMSIDLIVKKLFNENTAVFYTDGVKHHKNEKKGGVNNSALNKFQKFFPNYTYDDITPDIVKKFMKLCLQNQCNNGVHAYLRSLNTTWNNLSDKINPFSGIRPKLEPTVNKNQTATDIYKIYHAKFKPTKRTNRGGAYHFRNYYMLQILLGGIDSIDLANLTTTNIVEGRVQFTRGKGGTEAFVNNKILPEAQALLDLYDCKPYLVPIYQYKDYKNYTDNFASRFHEHCKSLKLTKKPLLKTPRYTFINMAKQLMIPENITMEIVGHTRKDTHSIYQAAFAEHIRDKAHKKIIKALLYKERL